jgi:hypothetical protein
MERQAVGFTFEGNRTTVQQGQQQVLFKYLL